MKRNMIMTIAGAFFMVLAGAAVVSAGSIKNSKHDFGYNGSTWVTDGQICQPCHTPHNSAIQELLWNHDSVAGSFTMYSSYALNALAAGVTQPDATSLKCLSCHDGSVALDSFGGATGVSNITGSARIGQSYGLPASSGDLSNDHPIGFSYASVADGGTNGDAEIFPKATIATGNIYDILTANDVMGCYTCHDVHNTDTPAGVSFLLRDTNSSSALCLTCHNK